MQGPKGATSSWNLGKDESWVYEACAPSVSSKLEVPLFPPSGPALCSDTNEGQDPSGSFSQGWAGMSKGGLPNHLCQQSSFFLSDSTGKGLAAACFSSSSPRLSSSLFPPPTTPSQYQSGSSSLPVVSASLLTLPSGSQLSSSEQGSRQGREGRTVTRHSCWQRSAALRVAPSAQQQDTGFPSGGQCLLPGVTFCKRRWPI